MIFFDATKSAAGAHRSGLMRVSARLRGELGAAATSVAWESWDRSAGPSDWFLTAELFSEAERPGLAGFLAGRRCRAAAIFHDLIPLRFPHTTWPRSVARHPEYVKLLARFDRVWADSAASRDDLLAFWRWQGIERPPPVDVLALGADFNGSPRATAPRAPAGGAPALLCVGIVEPRKNQALLLDVCETLWGEGRSFELHVVGRVNPHFGRPIARRMRSVARRRPGLLFHPEASDGELSALYARARASVFPSLAEGCGLPVLESLWMGVPCICSDLPVLLENARGGGCLWVPPDDPPAWASALRRILDDDALAGRLAAEASSRPLPTWAAAARSLSCSFFKACEAGP
jgi:glycosyltransferase involved in cell wall biosynthesis